MEVKAEYLAIFSEEASDQLREWEESLLALEKSPGDREQINGMFRAIHTLKGSAGFIGFGAYVAGLLTIPAALEATTLKQLPPMLAGFDQAAGQRPPASQRLLAALDEQQFPVVKDSRADAQQRAFGIAPAGAAPTVHGDFFWLILHPGTGAS